MNIFQVKTIIHARQSEHADAMRLSMHRNNNTESRLILRAPLFIKELKKQVRND